MLKATCPHVSFSTVPRRPIATNGLQRNGIATNGPAWQHFGWQVTQRGLHPSKAAGQLVSHATTRGFKTSRSGPCSGFRTSWRGAKGFKMSSEPGARGFSRGAQGFR